MIHPAGGTDAGPPGEQPAKDSRPGLGHGKLILIRKAQE